MTGLWFVVPAHGRLGLTAICLRQLRRTCDALADQGIDATAVVVGDDENLEVADELGFATVTRDNHFLGRKFNDGIQLALDPDVNPRPADYVVPCGSDDWVHPGLFTVFPGPGSMVGFKDLSFVREDGQEITYGRVEATGGCGIRIYPPDVMATLNYRPADEDRKRACDTSILYNLRAAWHDQTHTNLNVIHPVTDPRQIVDWKSNGQQLNTYTAVSIHKTSRADDPFETLAEWFPTEALDEMAAHYGAKVPA